MYRNLINWLLDKGLIFSTYLINIVTSGIVIAVLVISLLIHDWFHRNWP
jgi:hypothetical protein